MISIISINKIYMESELSFLKQIHLKSSEEYICNTVKDRIYSLEKDYSKTFTSYPDDHVTDFSEIFTYALNEFGIKWNQCNYVFFFNSLKYESYNIYTENDLLKSIRNRDENKTIFTKTEISKMSSADKSYAIILHFMQAYKMRHILILNEYIWE